MCYTIFYIYGVWERGCYLTHKLGHSDFQQIFRIFFGMIVSSWVIEIGWISIFSGLKMEFSPWHKIRFSSEHIYLRENNQAFDQTDSIRFSTGIQGYQSFWVIELRRFCMIISIKFTNVSYNTHRKSCEHNLH